MSDKIVMLYSGGADSRLMLQFALDLGKTVHCVLVDYGQLHKEELEYAKKQLEKIGIDYKQLQLNGYSVESGLTGSGSKGLYEGVSPHNVPARNSIFLTLAAGIAESVGAEQVWIGCDMSDYYGHFPDCKQEYIGKLNEVFKIAFSYPIEIIAPLLGFTKDMVISMLEKVVGIKQEDLYTGYREFS